MINIKTRKAKITKFLIIAVLSFGILFFLLRGPYLSNSIKRIIIPVLENVTRERVIIDKAVINLFPFYLQAKGFKVFDKDGNRLLWITKTRAYIDLTGLLSKEVRIRKLTLKEPKLTANEVDLRRIIDNINKSSSVGEEGRYGVSLKNIQLTDGSINFSNAKGLLSISGSGLFLNMASNNTAVAINVLLKDGTLKLPNNSELAGGFEGKITVEDQSVKVSEINVYSSNSTLQVKGEALLTPDRKVENGRFSTKAKIYASTLNKVFGLKQEKDGVLSFDGSIDLIADKDSKWPKFVFDLNTESRFYLETLMEIVKVDKNIKGSLSVNGSIRGTFPELIGKGTVKLENAVFDTLPIENLSGEVTYENQKFALNGFTAQMYDGKLEGDAHILIPHGDYSLTAGVSDVSSPEFFKFIKWEPPFQKGKINGSFQLNHEHGDDISVMADMSYLNTSENEGDLLSRLRSVNTTLELMDGILVLKDAVFSTSRSDLFLSGNIDLENETLALDMQLESRDVSDLTAPYYSNLIAPATFRGEVKGLIKAPEISGRLEAGSGSIHGIQFETAFADLKYKISSLAIERLKIKQEKAVYDISGLIQFRKAKELFSFNDPFYKAKATIQNADLKPFVEMAYKEIPVSGFLNGQLSFEGDLNNYSAVGDLIINDSTVYGQHLDKVIIKTTLHPEKIEFQSLTAYKGESNLAGKGTLFFEDKKINVSASSNNVQLSDIMMLRDYPFDAVFSMDLNGTGTIGNPDLEFSVNINESTFKNIKMGKGEITGRMKDNELVAAGSLVNGMVVADAKASLSGSVPWSMDIKLKKGRYDFLLSGFLREVPEDLLLSLEGDIKLKSQGRKISMYSKFNSANLSLYGYNFRNSKDIVFELVDDEFIVKSFSMTGSGADLSAAGGVKINEKYNLGLRGNVDIAPLRVITDKLASLKGRGDFNIDITGAWENPELAGEININNATATLKDSAYKIGPVNGTIFLKKDRFTFDSLKTHFAGGTIIMSGAGYLNKMSLERLFISSILNGIRIRPMEGVSAVFDGRLFYETSTKGSSLTGNIDIKKAKYKKKVEFGSVLIGIKEVKEGPVEYPEFLAKTELNIYIEGSDNIVIDNNIAQAPVRIALNVMGTVATYGLIGRIEASEGSIYFRSNEFKILEGSSVEFVEANSIAPVFYIPAETFVNDYYIKLTLDGTIDKFTLSLFSDPPLPEVDILSLLTFGQTKREARGFESGVVASEAASILTGSLQSEVEEKFKYITGFERFEIEPHTTTTGAFSSKITVGKRLLEDKLLVIYSTSIGTTEEHVIKLKYNLSKNVSVVGSKDEIGSVGADLKYRFEFK